MKLLVIGSGGREHALAWRLAQSDKVQKIYVAPGNAGTAHEDGLENLPITDIHQLVAFARDNAIHATVVGPVLMGMRGPVNSLQPTATVDEIVNLAAITVLQAQRGY